MDSRWARRDAKRASKRRYAQDNRVSVRLLERLTTDGKAKPIKRRRRA